MSRALNQHSKIAVTYDSIHFMRFHHNSESSINNDRADMIIADIECRLRNRWHSNVCLDRVRLQLTEHTDPLTCAWLYDSVMSELVLKKGKQIWGEKTQMAWKKIPEFLDMFPKGKAILLIRDPRDIVSSFKRFTTEEGLRYLDGAFASLSAMKYGRMLEKNLSSENFLLLRYEDLVSDYQTSLQRITDWIGVPWESHIAELSGYTDNTGAQWTSNSSYEVARDSVDTGSISKYLEELSNTEIYFIDMITRAVLEIYDYKFSAKPLDRSEWLELYELLNDDFIKQRYYSWLKSNDGIDTYPSEPPRI